MPRRDPKAKHVMFYFGGKAPYITQRITVNASDTAETIYQRVISAFQPHIRDSEIVVSDTRTKTKIDLHYHGLVNGATYRLGVSFRRKHGPGYDNAATLKTRKSIQLIMEHWCLNNAKDILSEAIAPLDMSGDVATGRAESPKHPVLDPDLWSASFTTKLQALASICRGSQGHVIAVKQLESAVRERLARSDLRGKPELGVEFLKSQDIISVIQTHRSDGIDVDQAHAKETPDLIPSLASGELPVPSLARCEPGENALAGRESDGLDQYKQRARLDLPVRSVSQGKETLETPTG